MSFDRFKDAVTAVMRELIAPRLTFLGIYEYAAVTATGGVMSGRPTNTDASLPTLPDLSNVPMLPSIIGGSATYLTPGAKFLVAFVNGSQNNPCVIAGDPNATPDTVSLPANLSMTIAGGVQPAARLGDLVQAGPFSGTVTSGSLKTKIG